ncbi:phage antirepressor KilAC domain-containing protein [Rhodococcus rhodochrous]|uniref:phage antirepressor KilAC domain-containing protein n=1 Tax=Rhodococcus TaxID=1827 RepID=UPI0006C89E60
MSDLILPADLPTGQSPFDSIRQLRADGTEFWSARDLMPLLGYDKWERFEDAIDRAIASMVAQGHSADTNASRLREPIAKTYRINFHLSRFACYLIAMNGDPRKPEVAAAQAYFAIRTREAETRAPALTGPELLAHAVIEAQQMLAQKDEKIAELEPRAQIADELMNAEGLYTLQAAAKALGWGPNILFRDLRRLGILQGNRLPYQRYAHHFEVKLGTRQHPHTGETIPTARTYVKPSALPFLRKKLHGIDDPVQLPIGGDAA